MKPLLLVALAALAVGAPMSTAGAAAPPNDTYYDLQWGPRQIHAEQAWATSTGKGQVIAVVDSGVDLAHPDLSRKPVGGATFTGCPDAPNGCGDGDWESGPATEAASPNGTRRRDCRGGDGQRHRHRQRRARREAHAGQGPHGRGRNLRGGQPELRRAARHPGPPTRRRARRREARSTTP